MTFSSLTFLVFFAGVFSAYWLIGRRRPQNVLLLVASYVFYGWWDWRFAILMLVASLGDFAFGWAMHRSETLSWRRFWLALTLVSNLGLLGFFKYYNFFAESFAEAARSIGWEPGSLTLDIILPVGISFYTFQTLSYTIDIYRRHLTPTNNVIDYLAFVSFFPQLVAGPIERAVDLLPQFGIDRKFDPAVAADGLRQMLWGLFKKLAVADRLALLVEPVYANPTEYSGAHLAFATICFAFQIYCDFSGYSDIAVGCGKQFGIRLSRNFAYPYFSQSVGEFWRRWHISLSTWFRDYVYIPLGGGRGSKTSVRRNLLVTFVVSGLWHGAAWTYIIWGGLHGLLVAIWPSRKVAKPADGAADADANVPGGTRFIPSPAIVGRIALTFLLVCIGWVFFRAESFHDACLILARSTAGITDLAGLQSLWDYVAGTPTVAASVGATIMLVSIEWVQRRHVHPLTFPRAPRPVRWACYSFVLWATVLLIPDNVGQTFIYFDF